MNDRFIRLSISLARLQKVIQRIKASGMSRIELKAGHTLVLCRLAAAPEGGAALLGGLYDRKTLSELTAEVPMRRLLYMTDTIQRTAAALPRSIRQRTDAERRYRACDHREFRRPVRRGSHRGH